MKIIRLPNEEAKIRTVAQWLYDEFGSGDPANSVARAVDRLRSQFEGREDVLFTFVCEASGVLIGTASAIKNDSEAYPELSPWLGAVFVRPEYRGKGIGSLLCNEVSKELRRIGFAEIFLFTANQQKLYERLGWEVFGTETLKNGKSAVVMKLK